VQRVIFLNQFSYPDEPATSLILTDCVFAAVEAGARTVVVCSAGGYAAGGAESGEAAGVEVQPVAAPEFVRGVGCGKLLSYAAYVCRTAWRVMRCGRGDTVVSMTTPPLLGVLGRLAQMVRGAHHVIWEMDVYPDVAVELGVLRRGSLLERFI
jgi:hypothetical protein